MIRSYLYTDNAAYPTTVLHVIFKFSPSQRSPNYWLINPIIKAFVYRNNKWVQSEEHQKSKCQSFRTLQEWNYLFNSLKYRFKETAFDFNELLIDLL